MYTLLITLSTIIAVLLVIVVLMQSSKGGGLAGTLGGANMGAMFGTRRTADFLSQASWWLGGSLAVLALMIHLFFLPSVRPDQIRTVIFCRSIVFRCFFSCMVC